MFAGIIVHHPTMPYFTRAKRVHSIPLHRDSIAVMRLVADNRTALANQAVEQRRLADVGPANDGDERQS